VLGLKDSERCTLISAIWKKQIRKAYDLKLMARWGISEILLETDGLFPPVCFDHGWPGPHHPYLTKEAIDRYIVVAAREVV